MTKENLKFNAYDSWAIWETPKNLKEGLTDEERQKMFGEAYIPKHFPIDQLPKNLDDHLKAVEYVIVGLNPGNEGASLVEESEAFLNFHGLKKSLDYRLAAALYGTKLWGAFMTDLIHVVESDSSKVSTDSEDVAYLEAHLDELGISENAVLVALGGKTEKALTGKACRKVVSLPHYSGANGHWRAEKTRQKVEAIASN